MLYGRSMQNATIKIFDNEVRDFDIIIIVHNATL